MHKNALPGITRISASGIILSTNGNSHTQRGTVSGKNGSCQSHACTGIETLTSQGSSIILRGYSQT